MTDYDSPWKVALDVYFPAFVALCFPDVYDRIDWTRGHDSLDNELQKIVRDAETGRRVVDKLVRVWGKSGREEWILVHVEVQTQPEAGFPRRMFVYYYRLVDRYNKDVVSLAVLADSQPNWHPDRYHHELLGCSLEFRFPIVKLLDFTDRAAELETSSNPFAVVVLAHLKSQETRGDNSNRFTWKLRLVKGLYDRGLTADDVRQLFRFIDWLIDLPIALERQFSEQLQHFEEEKHMSYVTSVERLAHERGVEEGIEKGIEKGIEQGREQGICMGRIHLCQQRLGQPLTPTDQLFALSINDLRRRAVELESELFASE